MTKPDPYMIDDDNPELTDEQLATMKPASAVFTPEQLAALTAARKPGRPLKDDRKVAVKLRIDPDVLNVFKASGPGWQTRINDVLRCAAETEVKR